MTRRKKIELINRLINQLNNLRKEEGKTFVIQCKSVIKSIFGVDSPEYEFFSTFEIDLTAMGAGEPYAENHFQREKRKLLNHLNSCINTINNTPQSNWVLNMDNLRNASTVIGLVVLIFSGGFYMGTEKTNQECASLKREVDKLHNANELLTTTIKKFSKPPATPKHTLNNH